ncbi:HDOD domain-containing protein [Bacillus sp. FJAT-50079]|uniref:EAL and HDOD domain-containing protein n=1 Tax=Bacillus sp. FJAT-50079 TaxID=2833577 RepID=UPI001BC9F510|nr:HDOD domain-containing protein [Bacillus sp. FJAT-50079]MBS4210459.1 HDOD domain-containing protein [Bacillus sp. FJAT-50079]
MEEVFVGKQPILDVNGDLFSFELLYRNSDSNAFPDVDPEMATIEVIVNTYLSPGFEQIAAKKTFINFTATLLATDIFDTLDPDRVVIEILEDVAMTPALLTNLKKLKSMGFQLALDDFILQWQHILYPDLFQTIDYIKVDFLSTTQSERSAIEALKFKYPHIILLAEKIETTEQFELAKSLGYELFQGYYFAKPGIVKGAKLPSDTLLYFEILKLLDKEEPNIEEIATLIMRDISLTYKLLKHLNTYAFGSSIKITSIHQAIVRMGLKEFKKWIQFLIIYQKSSKGLDGRIKVLVNFSLTRAKICELLAARSGKYKTDEYYMLGMFSLIDLILKQNPTDIFPLLPVSQEVIETLGDQETEMTPYLQIAEALERLDYRDAVQQAERLGISRKELSELALKAAVV